MNYTHGKSLIKIAVVEDHALLRQALCQVIDTWHNCKVVLEAGDGMELIGLLNKDDLPQLLIIDLELPKLNGFDTIKQIKAIDLNIKVCAFSFYNSQEVISRLIALGFHGFVDKTNDLSVLKTAINEIMKSGYYYSDKATVKALLVTRSKENKTSKFSFSEEELQFLKLIASDKTYKEIAKAMNTDERHIDYLRSTFFDFYDVKSRSGLVVKAIEKGLLI
ncbi:MAG: response regulator transcription factor [Chitinophagaceae bacterium]|nr:response regulator transcription factor [Chitinophagaceae bacterium]